MAYVPGYQHDVFISYAHGDDRAWITRLVERLKPAVKQRLGVEARFWLDDDDLRRSRDFSKEIPDSVQSSAILVLLPSPTYIRSRYCVEEECRVYEEARILKRERFNTVEFQNELFVLRCLIVPIDNNEHWELFPGATDIAFCDESGTFPVDTSDFERQFRRLLEELVGLLKRMRNHSTPVFLYPDKPTPDIEEARKALADELLAQSYRILPDRQLNFAGQLREAAMSVFLLGEIEDNRALELTEIASKQSRPWVVWRSPTAARSASVAQSGFVKALEQLDSASKTYLDENISVPKLKEQVLATLRPDSHALSPSDGRPRVYVIFDQQDRNETANAGLIQFHYRRDFHFEFSNDRRQHSQWLSQSDGVLLVWGSADENWCSHEFEEMLRISRSAKSKGLCLFQPEESKKTATQLIRDRFRDLHVAEQYGPRFDPGRLSPFFEKLQ